MKGKDTLRGCVIMKWRASGNPGSMQYSQVLQWAEDCDDDFCRRGINPAPVFRKYLESGDERRKGYLRGERFPFRIVEGFVENGGIQSSRLSRMSKASDDTRRACLKCGRLNLIDAVFCSYCRQLMPRGPNEKAI